MFVSFRVIKILSYFYGLDFFFKYHRENDLAEGSPLKLKKRSALSQSLLSWSTSAQHAQVDDLRQDA